MQGGQLLEVITLLHDARVWHLVLIMSIDGPIDWEGRNSFGASLRSSLVLCINVVGVARNRAFLILMRHMMRPSCIYPVRSTPL
jgi:hypothetical protein